MGKRELSLSQKENRIRYRLVLAINTNEIKLIYEALNNINQERLADYIINVFRDVKDKYHG